MAGRVPWNDDADINGELDAILERAKAHLRPDELFVFTGASRWRPVGVVAPCGRAVAPERVVEILAAVAREFDLP